MGTLEIFKRDEFVFFEILEKAREPLIKRFHFVAEFFRESVA